MCACSITVSGDDHALTGRQTVVLDHPCGLADRGPEPSQSGIQICWTVNGLTGCGANPGSSHHVLGEGFGTLDPRGIPGRAETGDTRVPDRIGHSHCQGNLRTDHHQIGTNADRQCGDLLGGGDVDVVLVCNGGGTRVARRYREVVDSRVLAEPDQQGVFAGT